MHFHARRNWFLPLSLSVTLLTALPTLAACFDPFGRQAGGGKFEFVTSKSDQVAPSEIVVTPTEYRDSFEMTATVSAATEIEASGTKQSQRTEILEVGSDLARSNTEAWECYAWSVSLPASMPLPAPGGSRAKLTIAQFHQNMAAQSGEPAVLFIDLDPGGNVVALFNEPVGKRSTILIPGGKTGRDALGKEWEVEVSAKWATDASGSVVIRLRERGKGAMQEVMADHGQNATAGYVYQKLGVYRHNIERDPAFAAATASARYRDISRNGVKATFRGQSGGMTIGTAPQPLAPSGVAMAFAPQLSAPSIAPVPSTASPTTSIRRSAPVVSLAVRIGTPGLGGGSGSGMTAAWPGPPASPASISARVSLTP